jgi:hypothetical protein
MTNMKAVNVEIKYSGAVGQQGSLGALIPMFLVDEIMIKIMSWKEQYQFTFSEMEKYNESLKELTNAK